jgi:hypothetical protein
VAGTIFTSSTCPTPSTTAIVTLTGADGQTLSLPVNEVGNYFTDAGVVFPVKVVVEAEGRRVAMAGTAHGACGICHTLGGKTGLISTH